MKTKLLLSFFVILLSVSCKKGESENTTNPSSQQPTATDSVAEPTDTAGVNAPLTDATADSKLLRDFYKKNQQKPQLFVINNSKDTTIVCAQKTRIRIKSNSFVAAKTGKALPNTLQISVQEYYKVSDILLAQLSTTTNGNLLETGGMLHITANAGGEQGVLKKGSTIEIEMPRKEAKPGMQLYTGNWNKESINWQVQKNTTDLNQTFTTVDENPKFPGGIDQFYSYISKNIYMDDDATTTKILATFTVDKEGKVINPRIIRGSNSFLNLQILKTLAKSPKFIPGKMNGVPVNVFYTIPITITGNELVKEQDTNFQKKLVEDYTDKDLQNAKIAEVNFYLFSSSSLGYINCDRLWKTSTAPKIDYAVNFKNENETSTTIIFHRVKSMMRGVTGADTVMFANIPSGEKVTLVVIKYQDSKPYLAVKETVTSAKGVNDLVFQPLTLQSLQDEMKKLDRLY